MDMNVTRTPQPSQKNLRRQQLKHNNYSKTRKKISANANVQTNQPPTLPLS
jgi:hypothetical protein